MWMLNSITRDELEKAIMKTEAYVVSVYSTRTAGYYCGALEKLRTYSQKSSEEPCKSVPAFYELITKASPYERPETSWQKTQARAILMLLDILNGDEPKREYYYKKRTYEGTFANELTSFQVWRASEGMSEGTMRKETLIVTDFLIFLEKTGVPSLSRVNSETLLDFLKDISTCSDLWTRACAYTIRKFLSCPALSLTLGFDPAPLLSGFRHNRDTRLESYYTPDEIRAVMNAVDRNTCWGKTIYAMMLLACVYGLRVSDIRELFLSSIRWKSGVISIRQVKTKRFLELPLIDEVMFALLDYLKNVRPTSDDPHVFLRRSSPHTPYSKKDNFGSKVSVYFRKAGVDTTGKHHGLHSMRHSLASNLLAENTPINEIASIAGHLNVRSTKAYIRSDIQHLRLAALEVPPYGE